MAILELVDTTVLGEVERVSDTEAAKEEALTESVQVEMTPLSGSDLKKINAEGWRRTINEPLIDWGRDPSQLEDDGIDPPTTAIVTLASRFAMFLRNEGLPAPDRVIPSGDGGIVFKRSVGEYLETIEIGADASIQIIVFHGSKIDTRQTIQ